MTERTKVIKVYESFRLGYCHCGCGEEIQNLRNRTNPYLIKFKRNHHWRLSKNKRDQRGEKNSRWKGGVYFDDGYWILTGKGDHPNSQKSDGHIPRHVYNYTVRDGELFCCMLPWGRVHHIIPVKEGGSDDLENLEGMILNKHISHHHKGKVGTKKNFGGRICLLCNSNKTIINKSDGHEIWYKYKDGFICPKCYKRNKG